MDLSRNNGEFSDVVSGPQQKELPAGAVLTAGLVREMVRSQEIPREMLALALQESARQFESLLSFVSGTFYRCEIAAPWHMEFISFGVEAITGHKSEFFATTPFGEIIEPDDLPDLEEKVRRAVRQREQFSACYRIRHKSGEIRWVREHGSAVYDVQGKPQFLEGFIRNVTQEKHLQAEAGRYRNEIETLNSRMARILKHTLEGIVSVDSDWNFRFANRTALKEMGQTQNLVGKNALEIFPWITETDAWPTMQRAMAEKRKVRAECHVPGNPYWFELYAVPHSEGLTAFFRNISDRKMLETRLVGEAAHLRAILDSIPDMVWTANSEGRSDFYNKAWLDFIGEPALPVLGNGESPIAVLVHPEDRDRVDRLWRVSVETGQAYEAEIRLRHHSGEYRWTLARAWPQTDNSGKILQWCGVATDIHQRWLTESELRESRNLQENILDASPDGIAILDLDGRVVLVNATALENEGLADSSTIEGRHWADLWPDKVKPAARRAIQKALKGNIGRFSAAHPTPKGKSKWWDVMISPIRDTEGQINGILCISRDITEQRRTADRLRIASECDFLTSLPNRRAFEDHLKTVIGEAAETHSSVGLMLLDLDHFKHVNDTLGHLAGDHLLQMVGKRLKSCMADSGFVARLGGDEFAIVLHGILDESELIGAATKVLSQLDEPVTFDGRLINGGLSVGCAIYPRDAHDAQDLLKHADTALYDLKASGRGGIQMFSRQMKEAAERTANQLNLARTVIHDDAVEPYYQPKVSLVDGEVAGFEALLRWWCPGDGIQPPSSVAEAFNDYELSTKIGSQMQMRVLSDMHEWLTAGLDLPPVSINASPAEFLRDDYAENLLRRLDQHQIPAKLIEVEITEHVFLERRSEQVVRALALLKGAGVRIALDDFGTGHSSLSYLRDFPVDVIKIDRSFVSRMLTKPAMAAIVEAVTRLGPSLSLDIVAEGIETPEQLHVLRDSGCKFGQGYLFGRPMSYEEIARRLTTKKWPFKLNVLS